MGNERGDAFRETKRDAESGRRAVVENVDGEFFQAELLDEIAHDLGNILEGVGEAFVIRRVGEAEAGQIGRDDVEIIRELRNQIAEHVARRGKAVQEQDDGFLCMAGLAIENFEAVHERGFEGDVACIHRESSGFGVEQALAKPGTS